MRLLPALLLLAVMVPSPRPAMAGAARQQDAPAGGSIYDLPIGDPDRRDRTVRLVLDAPVDTADGSTIDPDGLAARLDDARLLLLGESHTSLEAHHVQLQVLQALQRRGRALAIGLEMFPVSVQPVLDDWVAGRLTDAEFLERSNWYEHWGYDWRYYRDLFAFAREHRIPLHGINIPRSIVTAVRRGGLDALTAEQAKHLPPRIDVDSPELREYLGAALGGGSAHGRLDEQTWTGLLAAQATWDASMAWNMLRALEAKPAGTLGVILAGAGHAAYGVGIERQARNWIDEPIASVIPVPVADDDGPRESVRASYARFVWGVPYERWSTFPSLGVSTSNADGGCLVIVVDDDSPAAAAGLKAGDVIVSVDGQPTPGRDALARAMASRLWGEVVTVEIRRDGATRAIQVPLRRR